MIFLRELGSHVVACDNCITTFEESGVALQLVVKLRLIQEAEDRCLKEAIWTLNRASEALTKMREHNAESKRLGNEADSLIQSLTLLEKRVRELSQLQNAV